MVFELIDSSWDKVIDRAVSARCSELRIICPFIKRGVAERFLRCGRPDLIEVLTRFNLGNFYDVVSDAEAMRLFLESGAQIRGIKNLHSKLYLFGSKQVIVTSANLTDAALLHNHEFGFVSDDSKIVSRCREYFNKLWKKARPDLTSTKIDEWDRLLTRARAGQSPMSQAFRWPDDGANCGFTEPQSAMFIPPVFAEATAAFVKFFGESHRRAERNVRVSEEVRGSGSHWAATYPKGKRPRRVKDGSIIFMARLVRAPADTLIFGRAVAIHHQEGRDDATARDIALRPWKVIWPHYVRVHHPEFVAGTLANGVSLSELMEQLGSNTFASTKRNAAKGSGNIDPRKAYMQQAAVELTPEASASLNAKLENAFIRFGKLPAAEIAQLDPPGLMDANL